MRPGYGCTTTALKDEKSHFEALVEVSITLGLMYVIYVLTTVPKVADVSEFVVQSFTLSSIHTTSATEIADGFYCLAERRCCYILFFFFSSQEWSTRSSGNQSNSHSDL